MADTDKKIDDDANLEERLTELLAPEILGDVQVNLAASLGRGNMTLHDLASLKNGTVVALDTPLNGQVDLMLNGRVVARGDLVAVGDNFAVRVTDVLLHRSR